MSRYDELQAAHQQLLRQRDTGNDPAALLNQIQAYIEQVKTGAQEVPDARDRSQLRAILRFWAAFVYEHTKTYPDTTLRPFNSPIPIGESLGPEESVSESAGCLRSAIAPLTRIFLPVLAGVVIVGGLILLFVLGVIPGLAPTRPTPTKIAIIPSKISMTPSPNLRPSDTPASTQPTGIPSNLLTFQAQVKAASPAASCKVNQYTLTLDFSPVVKPVLAALNDLGGLRLAPLHVVVSQVGTGEVVNEASLPWEQAGGPFQLSRPVGTETLLVQVDQADLPKMVFEAAIVQFQAKCQRSEVTVLYELGPDDNVDTLRLFLADQSQSTPTSGLALDWRLSTWGPSPFEGQWVAGIILLPRGGDGHFIFWVNGPLAPTRLPDNQYVLQGRNCQPASAQVGVTSNGLSAARLLLLHAPVCP